MKKLIVFILVITMTLVSLAACGGSGGKTGEDGSKAPAATTGEEEPKGTEAAATTAGTAKAETTKAATTKDVTTAAPVVTEAPVQIPTVPAGVMVYYEDFNGYPNTSNNEDTMKALGWKILNLADGALTDNTGKYSIQDGMLSYLNYDGGSISGKDSYVLILTGEYMAACSSGDYTLQYDIKYTAAGNATRYAVIILNYSGADMYDSFHLRICGNADHQRRQMGSNWLNFDIEGEFRGQNKDEDATRTSIVNKLYGIKFDSSAYALTDKSITIRIQANYAEGPYVYCRANDLLNAEFKLVSKPDPTAQAAAYWNAFTDYTAVCFKLGSTIDGYLDNIAIWTGLGEMPAKIATTDYESAIAPYLAQIAKKN